MKNSSAVVAVKRNQSGAHFQFEKIFDRAVEKGQVIDFSPTWVNGTGYFDGAVSADLGLASGEVAVTTAKDGRRLVIQGTPWGNIVTFERYSPGHGDGVVVCNVPRNVERLLPLNTALDENTFIVLFPTWGETWGAAIADLLGK